MTSAFFRVMEFWCLQNLLWGCNNACTYGGVEYSLLLSRFFLVCLKIHEEEGGLQPLYQRLERKHLVCPGIVIVKMNDTS